MKIKYSNIYYYEIPFRTTIRVKDKFVNIRRALLVELKSYSGKSGFGEVSPLPGVHKESFIEAYFQLCSILKINDISKLKKQLISCYDSVRFGVEIALVDLIRCINKVKYSLMFGNQKTEKLSVNGLIDLKTEDIFEKSSYFINCKFKTIKIKISGLNLMDDICKIKKICSMVGNDISIRIDVNQLLDLDDAIIFCKELSNYKIEYIEDPVKNILELPFFSSMISQSVALDESIYNGQINRLKNWDNFSFLILKPSRIGSLKYVFSLIQLAHYNKKHCIISSCYETGVGLSFLSFLACSTENINIVSGISTFNSFTNDILIKPFSKTASEIDIEYCMKNLCLFMNSLSGEHCVSTIR
jgi:O-succinylbenzoate synthase